jgi:hypothetical protein
MVHIQSEGPTTRPKQIKEHSHQQHTTTMKKSRIPSLNDFKVELTIEIDPRLKTAEDFKKALKRKGVTDIDVIDPDSKHRAGHVENLANVNAMINHVQVSSEKTKVDFVFTSAHKLGVTGTVGRLGQTATSDAILEQAQKVGLLPCSLESVLHFCLQYEGKDIPCVAFSVGMEPVPDCKAKPSLFMYVRVGFGRRKKGKFVDTTILLSTPAAKDEYGLDALWLFIKPRQSK